MFRKSSKVPERKEFSLTREEVIEDIKNVCNNEEQREKLYICIDDKMPVLDKKFTELQNFVKSTSEIEEKSEDLKTIIDTVKKTERDISEELTNIKTNIADVLEIETATA